MDWLTSIGERLRSLAAHEAPRAVVRVTVAAVRGSAPREPGACMLVGEHSEDGTIGGGHLELLATGIARQMLSETAGEYGRLDRFPLGATLGQCCGGIVELWFERFTAADLEFIEQALALRKNGLPLVLATTISRLPATRHRLLDSASAADAAATALLQGNSGVPRTLLQRGAGDAGSVDVLYERIDRETTPLWLFGAGHVGKALAKIFAELPLELTWVDSRDAIFPVEIPHNVRVAQYDVPADAVADAPANAMFLVLTHSHDMDFDICRAILERGEFAWAGLIGSKTKAARFVQRLRQRGFSSSSIARITCPIGIGGIDSKLPAAIAVAVAAQVLQIIEAQRATRTQPESLTQAKNLFRNET
jgi:xanthine dehydrogenase accessory factor